MTIVTCARELDDGAGAECVQEYAQNFRCVSRHRHRHHAFFESTSPLSFIHSMNHVNEFSPSQEPGRRTSSHSLQASKHTAWSYGAASLRNSFPKAMSTPISHPMVHISTNATHSHSAKISAGRNQRTHRRQEGTHACREWFVLYRPSCVHGCVRVFRKSELRKKICE